MGSKVVVLLLSIHYPHAFFKKKAIVILYSPLSIILCPKPLEEIEIHSNLMCEFTHMNGACNSTLFLHPPPPPGPWEGVKRLNIIKFHLQSQFQRLLDLYTNFVCVGSRN